MSARRGHLSWRWAMYACLVLASGLFLLPVYMMLLTALKEPAAIGLETAWQLTRTWNWGSFALSWTSFLPKLRNSLVLTVAASAASAILGSLNGYVFAKWPFPGSRIVFAFILFGMFIPYQAVLIPLFGFVKSIGLYGSIWGLVLVHTVYGLPITTLIFRNYYVDIPDSLIESSCLDGAGFFTIYWRVDMGRYFARHDRPRLLRRILAGEGALWAATIALLFVNPRATLAVLVGPLLLMRTLMMMGNWAQHAFVCSEQPENPYRASITCLNTRYNRRSFNDGYHVLHHLQPRCHWTEHPAEYERDLAEYGRQDAIVLEGIDFFQVWVLLMAKRWKRLARAFVRLPGAPERSEDEVIAFLQRRVLPFLVAAERLIPAPVEPVPVAIGK